MNETFEHMRRIEEQIRSLIDELDWPEDVDTVRPADFCPDLEEQTA